MSVDLPLVSVIIPCYNYGAYIHDAIDSILAQTYTNWELLVVDDGSQDDTAAIVQQYMVNDARIKYHRRSNGGLSAARNTGLTLARGEYVQLLDADDYLAPGKLALHVQTLQEQLAVSLVFGDTYTFQHTSDKEARTLTPLHLQMGPISAQGQTLAMHLAYDNMFLPGNPLFRRVFAHKVGNFNEQLFSLEDWHFWYRGALLGAAFVYDNRPNTEFYARSHGNNMSGNRFKMWKNRILARQSLIEQMQQMQKQPDHTELDLAALLTRHIILLYEEQARFNLLYGRVVQGLINTARYLLRADKPAHILYDSAYWLKERLLGRNMTSV
jgi:glycosyltransferase involved in cell wall biosynthesis